MVNHSNPSLSQIKNNSTKWFNILIIILFFVLISVETGRTIYKESTQTVVIHDMGSYATSLKYMNNPALYQYDPFVSDKLVSGLLNSAGLYMRQFQLFFNITDGSIQLSSALLSLSAVIFFVIGMTYLQGLLIDDKQLALLMALATVRLVWPLNLPQGLIMGFAAILIRLMLQDWLIPEYQRQPVKLWKILRFGTLLILGSHLFNAINSLAILMIVGAMASIQLIILRRLSLKSFLTFIFIVLVLVAVRALSQVSVTVSLSAASAQMFLENRRDLLLHPNNIPIHIYLLFLLAVSCTGLMTLKLRTSWLKITFVIINVLFHIAILGSSVAPIGNLSIIICILLSYLIILKKDVAIHYGLLLAMSVALLTGEFFAEILLQIWNFWQSDVIIQIIQQAFRYPRLAIFPTVILLGSIIHILLKSYKTLSFRRLLSVVISIFIFYSMIGNGSNQAFKATIKTEHANYIFAFWLVLAGFLIISNYLKVDVDSNPLVSKNKSLILSGCIILFICISGIFLLILGESIIDNLWIIAIFTGIATLVISLIVYSRCFTIAVAVALINIILLCLTVSSTPLRSLTRINLPANGSFIDMATWIKQNTDVDSLIYFSGNERLTLQLRFFSERSIIFGYTDSQNSLYTNTSPIFLEDIRHSSRTYSNDSSSRAAINDTVTHLVVPKDQSFDDLLGSFTLEYENDLYAVFSSNNIKPTRAFDWIRDNTSKDTLIIGSPELDFLVNLIFHEKSIYTVSFEQYEENEVMAFYSLRTSIRSFFKNDATLNQKVDIIQNLHDLEINNILLIANKDEDLSSEDIKLLGLDLAYQTDTESLYWIKKNGMPLISYLDTTRSLNTIFEFGDRSIGLVDIQTEVEDIIVPCQSFWVTTQWNTSQVPSRELLLKVVLTNSETGQGIVSNDANPSSTPMTKWISNKYYTDIRIIDVPCDLPFGTYNLILGIYEIDYELSRWVEDLVVYYEGNPIGTVGFIKTLKYDK